MKKKKIAEAVLANQRRYDDAFKRWEDAGFPVGSKDYQIIYSCIFITVQNITKARLRKKVFLDPGDINDIALECTEMLVERDVIGKHLHYDSLGAFCSSPLMYYLYNQKKQFNDRLGSYELALENGYDRPADAEPNEWECKPRDEQMFYIGAEETGSHKEIIDGEETEVKDYKYYTFTPEQMKDPTFIFEFMFYNEQRLRGK